MADRIGLNIEKPLTKDLWILDCPCIMPGGKSWGCRYLYKSVVTELLTCLRNSINLPLCCSKNFVNYQRKLYFI